MGGPRGVQDVHNSGKLRLQSKYTYFDRKLIPQGPEGTLPIPLQGPRPPKLTFPKSDFPERST